MIVAREQIDVRISPWKIDSENIWNTPTLTKGKGGICL